MLIYLRCQLNLLRRVFIFYWVDYAFFFLFEVLIGNIGYDSSGSSKLLNCFPISGQHMSSDLARTTLTFETS